MTETPRLSASIAQKLLTECPLSAWSAHRLLGNNRPKTTDSQRAGRLWHAALLEGGAGIEVIDCDSFRSKAAREARDKAEHDGKIPVTSAKWDSMQHAVFHIHDELAAHGICLNGDVEERMEWNARTTGGEEVACSGFIDHRQGSFIDDLKTGDTCVTPHMAAGLIAKSHSLLQDAAYKSAVRAKHGYEECQMRFIFVQTCEPYSVTPVIMSGEFREISHIRWQRAIDDWAKYLALGTDRKFWPGPVPEGCATVHPPGWMMSVELEEEAMR